MSNVALLVTVDVEEDMPEWRVEAEITARNAASLPRFQRLCDEFGVRPTYLVDYPMATLSPAAEILGDLLEDGRCEIGAHLHPWNTPPLPEGPMTEALRATEIPTELMAAKMARLTHELEQRFGQRPRSFRAGRFGYDRHCLRVLEDLGYEVDSSITPGMNWAAEGGVDFTDAPDAPYFPDPEDPRRRGKSSIWEVPITTGFTRGIPRFVERAYHRIPRWTRLRGLLSSDYTALLDFDWLCPSQLSARDLIRLADSLIHQGRPTLNLFFHSSELHPGTSIYSRDEAATEAYFGRLRQFFSHMVSARGISSCTLSELRDAMVGPRFPGPARISLEREATVGPRLPGPARDAMVGPRLPGLARDAMVGPRFPGPARIPPERF